MEYQLPIMHYSTLKRYRSLAQSLTTINGYQIDLHTPIEWSKTRTYNTQFKLHTLRDCVAPYLVIFQQTNDWCTLRRAIDIALDFVKYLPKWSVDEFLRMELTDRVAWQDMATGIRVQYLVLCWKWGMKHKLLQDNEEKLLLKSIGRHGKWLREERLYQENNHGLFVNYGLVHVGNALGKKEYCKVAKQRFIKTLKGQVNWNEGLTIEPSAKYQFIYGEMVEDFLALYQSDELEEFLQRNKAARAYFLMPDEYLVQIGDTDLKRYQDQISKPILWAPETGYVIYKHGDRYLAFYCSYHTDTHKHYDELSFQLYDGKRILVDSGKYKHDPKSDLVKDYFTTQKSKNSLVIDKQIYGLPRIKANYYGSGLMSHKLDDTKLTIKGWNPLLWEKQQVKHTRTITWVFDKTLTIQDHIQFSDQATHIIELYFQVADGIDVKLTDNTVHLDDMLFQLPGEVHILNGWISPRQDEKINAKTIHVKTHGSDQIDLITTLTWN